MEKGLQCALVELIGRGFFVLDEDRGPTAAAAERDGIIVRYARNRPPRDVEAQIRRMLTRCCAKV